MPGNDIHSPDFVNAINDYFYFINRNYSGKQILKTVGDRYKLSGAVRTVLFRGIFNKQENSERSQKLTSNLNACVLYIDFYNVLFTLLNYKLGRLVFISTDKLCRDAGSLFGKLKKENYFTDTTNQIMDFLKILKLEYLVFYIDSPVSFSREHKIFLDRKISELQISGESMRVKSADNELKKKREGIICTSDSAIIDASEQPIADLSHLALNYFYKPDLLDLSLMLEDIY